jgi:hypothetical protein
MRKFSWKVQKEPETNTKTKEILRTYERALGITPEDNDWWKKYATTKIKDN